MTTDYKAVIEQAFKELGELILKREEADLQVAKRLQLIRATVNMLPDDEREQFESMLSHFGNRSVGLTEAIRNVLRNAPEQWHTATVVRDKLVSAGFDFSEYAANPLASIHTILKRFKPEEVERAIIEGVPAYRWKIRRFPREKIRKAFGRT